MEQQPFNDETPTQPDLTQPDLMQEELPEEEPAIGRVNRTVFWSVTLVALLFLGGMGVLVSRGAIVMAAAIPVPVTIKASSIKTTSFRLYPGISQADNSSPVAVNQLDGTLANLVITKTVSVPVIGNVTVTLKAGQGTPVSASGLTTDLAGLSSDSATFGGQSVSSNANGNAFEVDAKTADLSNVNISAPYLIANSMTLPGLTLTVG